MALLPHSASAATAVAQAERGVEIFAQACAVHIAQPAATRSWAQEQGWHLLDDQDKNHFLKDAAGDVWQGMDRLGRYFLALYQDGRCTVSVDKADANKAHELFTGLMGSLSQSIPGLSATPTREDKGPVDDGELWVRAYFAPSEDNDKGHAFLITTHTSPSNVQLRMTAARAKNPS